MKEFNASEHEKEYVPEYIEQQSYEREEEPLQQYEPEDEPQEEVRDDRAPEPEPEPEEEEKQKRPSKKDEDSEYKVKLNRIEREKYRLQNALEEQARSAYQVQQERDRYYAELEKTRQTGMGVYGENIEYKKTAAVGKKIRAIEEGDVYAQAQADLELANVAAEENRLRQLQYEQGEYVKQQQAYAEHLRNTPQPQPTRAPRPGIEEERVRSWVQRNPWINSNDEKNYNRELHMYIDQKVDELDSALISKGEGYKIFTEEYMNYIDSLARPYVPQNQPKKELRMNSGNGSGYVSPTSSRGASGGQSKGGGLTEREQRLATKWKIKPELFAQKIREDRTKGNDKRGYR
jgi:hypothetical protein